MAYGRYNGSNNTIAFDKDISSLTDIGTGRHNINFSVSITSTYTCSVGGGDSSNDAGRMTNPFDGGNFSSSYVRIRTSTGSSSKTNVEYMSLSVFR
jgi:hypothetical protein